MGTLQERTIGIVGGGSFMVTLPKGWLRYHRLTAGDKVVIITNEHSGIRPRDRGSEVPHRKSRALSLVSLPARAQSSDEENDVSGVNAVEMGAQQQFLQHSAFQANHASIR